MTNDDKKLDDRMETDPYLEGVSDAFDEVRHLLETADGRDDTPFVDKLDALQKRMMEGSTPSDDSISILMGKKAAALVGGLLTHPIAQNAMMSFITGLVLSEIEKRGADYAKTKNNDPCARTTCQHGKKQHKRGREEAFGYVPTAEIAPRDACTVAGCGCVGYVRTVPPTEPAK